MVVEVGLKAILEPELDRSSTKGAVDDLEGAMKEAEKLDVEADFSDVESRMEALQGQSLDIGASLSDAAKGEIGGGGGGGSPLSGAAAGQLMDQASGMLGKKMGLGSATSGGMAAGGAAGAIPQVALAGTVAFGMLKGIQSIASASPAFTKTMDMFGKAMELFFRPFGRALSELLRPAMRWLIKMAKGFNDFFGGGTLSNNKIGLGLGGAGGAVAGGVAGAKGGAAIGATAGSIIPGAGTAAGGLVGGIVGAIVGAVAGSGIGAMIGAKFQEIIGDLNLGRHFDNFVDGLESFWGDVENAWPGWPDIEGMWPGWPNLSAMWPGWPDVSGLWPGWPDVSGLWPGWPNLNEMWPGWPDIEGLFPGWPDLDDLFPGWPDLEGLFPGWPALHRLFPGWPDLAGLFPGWPTLSLPSGFWPNISARGVLNGISWPSINGQAIVNAIDWPNLSGWNPTSGGGDGWKWTGLATGGIVTSPTRAIIGEGGEDEAVLPLSRLESMLGSSGGRGQTSRTTSRVEQVDVDTSTLEDKLDEVARLLRGMDGKTKVAVGGQTIVKQSRKADDRYVNAREVTK